MVQGIFLLRIVASLFLGVYAASGVSSVSIMSSPLSLVVLGVSWVCITTAVYLYNGVQDVEEDQANASARPIACGDLSVPSAMLGVCLFGATGLVGIGIAHTDLMWAAAAMLVLGWMYSGPPLYLKRWPAGLAAIVVAAAILTYYSGYTAAGGTADMAPLVVFGGAMAAWMGLVGQTKDLSDVPGDSLAGRRSLPVVWGEGKARIAVSVAAIAVALGFLACSLYLVRELLPAAIVVCGGAIAVSALSLGSWGRGDKKMSRRPYKVFMATQYLVHAAIIALAFPVFGICDTDERRRKHLMNQDQNQEQQGHYPKDSRSAGPESARGVEDAPVSETARAAAVLEDRQEDILSGFESRLRRLRSPLLSDPQSSKQLGEQAKSVLRDSTLLLRGETESVQDNGDRFSRAVGVSRAQQKIRARESLQAALELSEAAISEVEQRLEPGLSASTMSQVAQVVYRSTVERVSRASVSYVDHLLSELKGSYAEERHRISRELHDRVASSLAVLHRNLELYRSLKDEDPDRAEQKLQLMQEASLEALDSVREVSAELRYSVGPQGLEAALSDFLSSLIPGHIHASISASGDEAPVPDYVKEELFLVLREAVRNAVTHSGAERIKIELSTSYDLVRAEVLDDGRGFDADSPDFEPATGLNSMTERVHLLGGSLDIRSSVGSGTTIEVQVPFENSESLERSQG